MSDSRVTLSLATFAQTMRALNPWYASEPDERLLEIVASQNPQCRLIHTLCRGAYCTRRKSGTEKETSLYA